MDNIEVRAIFTRASCKAYCLSSPNDPITSLNGDIVVCGTGCCKYLTSYCLNELTGELIINKEEVETILSCGGDKSTLFSCQSEYGLNYHTSCREYSCVNR